MEVSHYPSGNVISNNNICVVCGNTIPVNNIDLSLGSLKTSRSQEPVKEKLKKIFAEKWTRVFVPPPTSALCLQCFHLVERYDLLECKLFEIRDDLVRKFCDTETGRRLANVNTLGNNGNTILTSLSQSVKGERRSSEGNVYTNESDDDNVRESTPQETVLQKRRRIERAGFHELQSDSSSGVDDPDDPIDVNVGSLHLTRDTAVQQNDPEGFQNLLLTFPESTANTSLIDVRVTDKTVQNSPANTRRQSHQVNWETGEDNESANSVNNVESVYDTNEIVFIRGERLRIGVVEPQPDGNLFIGCCYCSGRFRDSESLRLHVNAYHRPEIQYTSIPVNLGLGDKMKVGACLRRVSENCHNAGAKQFACLYCDSLFKAKGNVMLHFREKHTPHKRFSCIDCNESFRRPIELSRHRD